MQAAGISDAETVAFADRPDLRRVLKVAAEVFAYGVETAAAGAGCDVSGRPTSRP